MIPTNATRGARVARGAARKTPSAGEMRNIGGTGFGRGVSFRWALTDLPPPASGQTTPRISSIKLHPWAPTDAASPEAYARELAQLRDQLKDTLSAEAEAVGSVLPWPQLRPLNLRRNSDAMAVDGFKHWLAKRDLALGGATATNKAFSSMYDALAHALFGLDNGHGPKLRWLAVQYMRLNQSAFMNDAKVAGRPFAAFLETHTRPTEPGSCATLRALANCLGVVVRVVSYNSRGEVRFAEYGRPEDGGGSGTAVLAAASAAPLVYLCAPTICSRGVPETVLFDVLVAVPGPPVAGDKNSEADATSLYPTAVAKLPSAAPAPHAGALSKLAVAEKDKSGADSDKENDKKAHAVSVNMLAEIVARNLVIGSVRTPPCTCEARAARRTPLAVLASPR